MTQATWILGLDLGQAADYTALAALKKRRREPSNETYGYDLCHLTRFELGTPYPDIVRVLSARIAVPPLPGGLLVVDATGVGRAVVDLLRQANLPVSLWPVTITSGQNVNRHPAGMQVPKKDLVAVLQVLLQTRRLHISSRLTLAQTLQEELENYRVSVSAAAHEIYGAGPGHHDDLVVALALAAWAGENQPTPYEGPLVYSSEPNLTVRQDRDAFMRELRENQQWSDEWDDWHGSSALDAWR